MKNVIDYNYSATFGELGKQEGGFPDPSLDEELTGA